MLETSPVERRQARRVSHQTEIYFKPGRKSNQRGFLRDISCTGSFLVAFERLYEGFEVILYVPIARVTDWLSQQAGRLQHGRIQWYLIYSFATLIFLLIFTTR